MLRALVSGASQASDRLKGLQMKNYERKLAGTIGHANQTEEARLNFINPK